MYLIVNKKLISQQISKAYYSLSSKCGLSFCIHFNNENSADQ